MPDTADTALRPVQEASHPYLSGRALFGGRLPLGMCAHPRSS
jgi:hypothetical protein